MSAHNTGVRRGGIVKWTSKGLIHSDRWYRAFCVDCDWAGEKHDLAIDAQREAIETHQGGTLHPPVPRRKKSTVVTEEMFPETG